MAQVDGRSYLSRGPVLRIQNADFSILTSAFDLRITCLSSRPRPRRLTREHLADSAADGCHDDQNVSVIHLRTQWY
jgi:hypothetical protein